MDDYVLLTLHFSLKPFTDKRDQLFKNLIPYFALFFIFVLISQINIALFRLAIQTISDIYLGGTVFVAATIYGAIATLIIAYLFYLAGY
ncbi:MAG: hypothetical protein ABJK37_00465 [Paraglaciecola sp.]|uniref:hypothetical protein n=1 Tax=Paraglaciecola sp. TaxID=1920173 RepID=UPI0032994FC1